MPSEKLYDIGEDIPPGDAIFQVAYKFKDVNKWIADSNPFISSQDCSISQDDWGFQLVPYTDSSYKIKWREESKAYWYTTKIYSPLKLPLPTNKDDVERNRLFYDANTLDSSCQEKKTSVWKLYNDTSHWAEDGIGTRIRREIVENQLDLISNDCFSILIYRFLKKQIADYITNNYSNSDSEHNVHPSDFEKPQPNLLYYLYRQITYMNSLHEEGTLNYIYTKIPSIFYPYRGDFVVKVGVNNQCSKKKKTGDKHKSTTNIDLQAVVGIIENFLPDSGYAVPDWTHAADIIDFRISPKIGNEKSGRDWWQEQLSDRLPFSFGVSHYQVSQWIGKTLLKGLKLHLEEFREEYENPDNYQIESIYNGITGTNLYTKIDPSNVLSYWNSVIEIGLPEEESPDPNTSAPSTSNPDPSSADPIVVAPQPLVDMVALAQFTREFEEKADIANINLALCSPGPQTPPPSLGCARIPNNAAPVPDWTKMDDPFLDGSRNLYCVKMRSPYESPAENIIFPSGSLPTQESGGDVHYRFSPQGANSFSAISSNKGDATQNLALMMAEQLRPGVERLLNFYGKDNSKKSVDAVMLKANASNYYVPTRPHLKMKIAITIPQDILKNIPDKSFNSPEEKKITKESDLSPYTVILKGKDINSFFETTTSALNKFEEQYESALFDGALKLPGLNLISATQDLKKYKTQLLQFLQKNKFPVDPKGKKSVKLEEVILNFSRNYELLSIKGKKAFCPPEELTSGFEEFKQKSPINNKTVSALVANLPSIVKDVTARSPIPMEVFTSKYIIPGILPIDPSNVSGQLLKLAGTANQNSAKILSDVSKPIVQIGDTPFNKLFSYPDLVNQKLGSQVVYTVENQIKNNSQLKDAETQLLRQKDLWVREFNSADVIFKDLPSILSGKVNNLENLFTELLDKLGVDGFKSILGKAIQSTAASLDPEDFIKSAQKALIENIDTKQLENLYKALPSQIQTMIKESLGEVTDLPLPWEMFGIGSRIETPKSSEQQFENKRKEIFTTVLAPLSASVNTFEEIEELVYPSECSGTFRPPGDSYEYSWEDENTLVWFKSGKTGQIDIDAISETHGVFKCRPYRELVKKPTITTQLTEGDPDA